MGRGQEVVSIPDVGAALGGIPQTPFAKCIVPMHAVNSSSKDRLSSFPFKPFVGIVEGSVASLRSRATIY